MSPPAAVVVAPPAPVPAAHSHRRQAGVRLPAATKGEQLDRGPVEGSSQDPTEFAATEVPHKLDLSLHRPLVLAPPGGETVHNLPGEADFQIHRSSLAQARIDDWIEGDSARRRVEKGLVDDWFDRLGRSLDGALEKNPPPPPALGAITSSVLEGYAAAAASYGKTGNPNAPSGPDTSVSAPAADMGASAGIIPFSAPRLQLKQATDSAAPLWAVIELRYGPEGKLADSRLLSSSGDHGFNDHVLSVVALGLPGLPDLPDGGLGIHPDGTRSVWEVEGHLTFERDVRTFNLKKDAWYLPLAAVTALAGAAAGSFDEVTGYVGFTDLRNPHLKCDVKLLQVY